MLTTGQIEINDEKFPGPRAEKLLVGLARVRAIRSLAIFWRAARPSRLHPFPYREKLAKQLEIFDGVGVCVLIVFTSPCRHFSI